MLLLLTVLLAICVLKGKANGLWVWEAWRRWVPAGWSPALAEAAPWWRGVLLAASWCQLAVCVSFPPAALSAGASSPVGSGNGTQAVKKREQDHGVGPVLLLTFIVILASEEWLLCSFCHRKYDAGKKPRGNCIFNQRTTVLSEQQHNRLILSASLQILVC